MQPEERQQINAEAKAQGNLQTGESSGDTLPGSLREGVDTSRTQIGGGISQAELDAEMEEREAALGEAHVGELNGEVVGTPAGRPLPGTPSR